ncbi:MBL fold hydrolase [Alicyclobacillus cellulosilyticus]|uniref:MBL fold hydrolase n=1 Tax=Alicyclobacillus cellulosilyticus TaxID=1003997 RepID=A0A917NJT4_9BACL|nr:MBL fold metallo-hydrolase [Alicyclobacillus cellulosilyticus]GGJ06013.1 MBL fold hydrolase [Alicyclobacillus cellulosilyticus]
MLRVQAFVVSPLQANCYVVDAGEDGGEAVIIDPGDPDLAPVFAYVRAHRLRVAAVWCTHAHLDHIAGVDVVRAAFGVPVYVHRADLPLWESFPASVAAWYGRTAHPLAPPDRMWSDGDTVTVGSARFEVRHTPGHSPGSVCLVGEGVAFTGDTVFAGSIGRVDLPLADPAAMQASLQRIKGWPATLVLYPGHMGATTLARELASNPFLHASS